MRRPPGIGRRHWLGTGRGGSYNPIADIPFVHHYWRADSGVTGTDPVTSYIDQVDGLDATPGNGPNTDTLGGAASLHFASASSEYLRAVGSNTHFIPGHSGTGGTWWVVFQITAASSRGALIVTMDDNNSETGLYVEANGAHSLRVAIGNSSGTAYAANVTGAVLTTDAPHYAVIRVGTGETNEVDVRVDGAAYSNSALTSPGGGNSTRDFIMGTRGALSGRYWNGHIAEAGLSDTYAPLSAVEEWEEYAAARYT